MTFRKKVLNENEGNPIIGLIGELDIYVSDEFKNNSIEILKNSKDGITYDFSELDYIDSTGLGALIAILKEARDNDKKIKLKNVNERIRKLFKITSIEDMFEFEGDE